jgi:hypothetical protein
MVDTLIDKRDNDVWEVRYPEAVTEGLDEMMGYMICDELKHDAFDITTGNILHVWLT